jgi:surface protein
MDILSYKLGQKSSGGGGGGSSSSDYFIEDTLTSNDIKYFIKKIGNIKSSASIFSVNCDNLEEIESLELPNVSTFNLSSKPKLKKIGRLKFGSLTSCSQMFSGCSSLKTIPRFETKDVTTFSWFCFSCHELENVPLFDTSSCTQFATAFTNCSKLTDQSLDNILQMCINATQYTGTKTLSTIGFNSSTYRSSRIQALPHYQDFINAGWKIGY